jgi:tRNA modification GTPase
VDAYTSPPPDKEGGETIDLTPYLGDTPPDVPITLIRNKIDLVGEAPEIRMSVSHFDACLNLSVKSGSGMDLLQQHLLEAAGLGGSESSDFSARERHLTALEDCQSHIHQGLAQLRDHGAAELIAEDLRYAQDTLGSITGRFHSDELLGEIFSSFCIGK